MFIKISEQPSLYNDLEKKSVHEILVDINREDQKVALAIQKTIPQIEKLVTQIVPRMKQGGRIFYMDDYDAVKPAEPRSVVGTVFDPPAPDRKSVV